MNNDVLKMILDIEAALGDKVKPTDGVHDLLNKARSRATDGRLVGRWTLAKLIKLWNKASGIMGPRRPRMTEGGGFQHGRVVSNSPGFAEYWVCTSCNRRQLERRLARIRHTRPKCKHCGALIHPIHEFEKSAIRKKTCKKCHHELRMGNRTGYCSSCFDGMPYNWRMKVLFKKGLVISAYQT